MILNRTRSRTNSTMVAPGTKLTTWKNTVSPYNTVVIDDRKYPAVSYADSVLTDQVGDYLNRRTPGLQPSRPCSHTTTRVIDSSPGYGSSTMNGNWIVQMSYTNCLRAAMAESYLNPLDWNLPVATLPSWESVASKFWKEVNGEIDPGLLSLATFGELRDLLAIVSKGAGSSLASLIEFMRDSHRALNVHSLKDAIQLATGADLAFMFGIKPIIQDIAAAASIVGAVQSRLNRLAGINGKLVTVSVAEGGTLPSFTSTGTYYDVKTIRSVCERRYSCKMVADYRTSDAVASYLMMQRLGLNKLATSAWELVPLSFVIDWFLKVQDLAAWFDDLAFKTPSPLIRVAAIKDIVRSTKIVQTREYTALLDHASGYPEKRYVGRVQKKYYLRETTPSIYNGTLAPSLHFGDGITAQRALTGMEIIAQMAL